MKRSLIFPTVVAYFTLIGGGLAQDRVAEFEALLVVPRQLGDTTYQVRADYETKRLIFEMTEEEVDRAFEKTKALTRFPGTHSVLIPLFTRLGEAGPRAALERVEALSPNHRSAAQKAIVATWVIDDLSGALDWLETLEDRRLSGEAYPVALSALAQTEPRRAAEIASGLEGRALASALRTVGWAWSAQDPRAAMAWSDAATDPFLARNFSQSVIMGWIHQAPAEAADYLRGLPSSAPILNVTGPDTVVSQWMNADPGGAIEYVKALPVEERDAVFYSGIGWTLGAVPIDTVLALKDTIPEEKVAAAFLQSAIRGRVLLGATDEAQALGEMIPVGPEKEEAYRILGQSWAATDPRQCATWLDKLEGGTLRQNAVTGFAHQTLRESPQLALEKASTIEDETVRADLLQNLASTWLRSDLGARPYIESSEILSDEQKKTLLAP